MLRLDRMTEVEFQAYIDTAVSEYARAHVKAGDCLPEEALELAQKDYHELLPDGLLTTRQFLFCARDDTIDGDHVVGMIWFRIKDARPSNTAFIFDFKVREGLRGMGYGRKLMQSFELLAGEMNIGRVSLNVFGYNNAARSLYEKMGYQITSIAMTKTLDV